MMYQCKKICDVKKKIKQGKTYSTLNVKLKFSLNSFFLYTILL